MYGDRGSPCLHPLSNLKDSDRYPFCKTQEMEFFKNITDFHLNHYSYIFLKEKKKGGVAFSVTYFI